MIYGSDTDGGGRIGTNRADFDADPADTEGDGNATTDGVDTDDAGGVGDNGADIDGAGGGDASINDVDGAGSAGAGGGAVFVSLFCFI